MKLNKQVMSIPIGKLDTSTEPKFVQPGGVTEARNVVQRQTGKFEKRTGHSALSMAVNSGTIDSARSLCSLGDTLALNTTDTVFVRSAEANQWIESGKFQPYIATGDTTLTAAGSRPWVVTTSDRIWTFAVGSDDVSLWYSVQTLAGAAIVTARQVSGIGAVTTGIRQIRAEQGPSGDIWVFYCHNDIGSNYSGTVRALRFATLSPASPPTLTTFVAANQIWCWDILKRSDGVLVFGAGGQFAGAPDEYMFATLNEATGLAAGAVQVSIGANTPRSGCWAAGADGSGGSPLWFVAMTGAPSATATGVKINSTTLAFINSFATGAITSTDGFTTDPELNKLAAYSLGGDSIRVLTSFIAPASSTNADRLARQPVYLNGFDAGVPLAEQRIARGAHVHSRPFTMSDGNWYVVTNYYDASQVQTTYHLRRLSGGTPAIVGQWSRGSGGDPCSAGSSLNVGAGYYRQHTAPVRRTGNSAILVCLELLGGFPATSTVGGGDYATELITVEQFATTGHMMPALDETMAILPSSWSSQIALGANVRELGPTCSPRNVAAATGSGTHGLSNGTYGVCAVYAIRDAQGRVWRSAPSPRTTIVLSAGTTTQRIDITVDYLYASNSDSDVSIEFYGTDANSTLLKLAGRVANVANGANATVTFTYGYASQLTEAIYTTGGVLENAPPPASVAAYQWRNRAWLANPEDGDVWFSQEFRDGDGLAFNEALRVSIQDGSGGITAIGAVDHNYLALFKRDAIYVVSGPGPDRIGAGGYQPLQVPGRLGCTNPRSVVTFDGGLMFQATDGLIWLLARDLTLQAIGQPIEAWATKTITAAVHVTSERHVRFFTSDDETGLILVYDYQHGQWYEWTGLALEAQGATMLSGIPYHIAFGGTVYQYSTAIYTDAGVGIIHRIRLAPISFAGIQGFGRCWRGLVLGVYFDLTGIRVTYRNDYEAPEQVTQQWTAPSFGPMQIDFKPTVSKTQAIQVTIEETGAGTNRAFSIESVAFEIGVRPTGKRVNQDRRLV